MRFVQVDFGGGMNLFDQDHILGSNQYGLAFNVRNRTSALESILSATLDSNPPPAALMQGLYAFDDYLLVFGSGRAYYKNIVNGDTEWTAVEDFVMSVDATNFYAQAIPASTFPFFRKLSEEAGGVEGTSQDNKMEIVNRFNTTTPSGLVVQDGINQPWLIKPDASAVKLQTYAQWDHTAGRGQTDLREYVPIMKQMAYINGILIGVAPDGKSFYRSVTGRPLDFVVNVDHIGAKGGDAETTSYSPSFQPITCLKALKTGELLVGTSDGIHPIEFNYEKTIFAEPTFFNRKFINAAIVNQYSLVDILVDYAFIDFDGVRSLRDVISDDNEGRNGLFSSRISNSLEGIYQTSTASVVFNNYALFSLNTIYGQVIAVYDIIRQQWVGFDDLDLDGPIKQFAVADQDNDPKLFCITATSIYQLYAGAEYLSSSVKFKSVTTGEGASEVKLSDVRAVIVKQEGSISDTVSCEEITDGATNNTVEAASSDTNEVENLRFNFSGLAKVGWKTSPALEWSGGKMVLLETNVNVNTSPTSNKQQAKRYA